MFRTMLALSVGAGLLMGLSSAGAVESGLKVGDYAGAFTVLDVTGPSKGEELCYRCKYGNSPVVAIFTRELSDAVADTVADVDKAIGKNKNLKSFVVLLTDDAEASKADLEKLAKEKNIKNVPLTIADSKGPANYKINKDAGVTVLMWNESEVRVNHAFEAGTFCSNCQKEVVADLAKLDRKDDEK